MTAPPPAETLASTLRACRRKLRMTQADVAEAIGTRQQNVANWETGSVPRPGSPDYDDILRGIAAFLSTSVVEVLRLAYAPWADPQAELRSYERALRRLEDAGEDVLHLKKPKKS